MTCGDFVNSDNEEEVEDLEENAEPLLLYFQQPFYYPICIGNVLAQRYRIEHKLGHGGFSTVWMAHDIVTKKDVALKVTILARDTQTMKALCITKSASASRTRPNFSFLAEPSRFLAPTVTIESWCFPCKAPVFTPASPACPWPIECPR
jgi:hypothetical protein